MTTFNIDIVKKNMTLVGSNEYEELLQENKELHNKVRLLTNDLIKINNESIKLNNELVSRNLEIEILRKENEELKEKIKYLESKIEAHEITITEQKNTIEKLENKVLLLTDDMEIIKNNKIYEKIIVGLQDFNALELLENKVSNPNILRKLRKNRINVCHYINDDYEEYKKNICINILIDKINNANNTVLEMIEDEYPGLLHTIQPYLIKKPVKNGNHGFIKIKTNWWNR